MQPIVRPTAWSVRSISSCPINAKTTTKMRHDYMRSREATILPQVINKLAYYSLVTASNWIPSTSDHKWRWYTHM